MSALEFEGRGFTVPASVTTLAIGGERMALALITGSAVRFGRDLIENAMVPGAVDLSMVPSGRCPLLSEHCYSLEALLGQVVAAEVDGQVLRAMVRFGPGKEPDRIWALLQAGFPLSLSAGAEVVAAEVVAEHGDQRVIRATRWRLKEISVVVFGKDITAHLRRLSWDEDAAEIVKRMNDVPDTNRQAVENALHLDSWRKWSVLAGVGIAADLGIDRDALCDALEERVSDHCDKLIADLAA